MRHGKYLGTAAVLTVMLWALIGAAPSAASAWFDPHGWWELEGEGYAERNSLRADLYVWGDLLIQTSYRGGERYVTDYDVWVTLDSPRLNINFWEFSAGITFLYPIRIPDVPPTLRNPFRLPPITKDGLTYDVEFTSATSGTIWIYGYVSGRVLVDSLSFVLKADTHPFRGKGSGCNTGIGAFGLVLPLVLLLRKKPKRNNEN